MTIRLCGFVWIGKGGHQTWISSFFYWEDSSSVLDFANRDCKLGLNFKPKSDKSKFPKNKKTTETSP